jgi:hypothetical protein
VSEMLTTNDTAVHVSLAWGTAPMTTEIWLALPEHESAECPYCGRPGAAVNDVFTCGEHIPHVRWRWPGVVGMD